MWYGLQDIEVWRIVPATGVYMDDAYEYHHTIYDVTYQPFSSNQLVRNNQNFSNVIGVLTCDIDEDIKDNDEIVYLKDGSYGRVQVCEPWDSGIIPHREVYVTYTQWDRQ
jgi:hypothetical protein